MRIFPTHFQMYESSHMHITTEFCKYILYMYIFEAVCQQIMVCKSMPASCNNILATSSCPRFVSTSHKFTGKWFWLSPTAPTLPHLNPSQLFNPSVWWQSTPGTRHDEVPPPQHRGVGKPQIMDPLRKYPAAPRAVPSAPTDAWSHRYLR